MRILLLDSGIGLIPFVNQIIKMQKFNEYYFFMDQEFFPYGNKTYHQLKKRLITLLKKFEQLNLDYLLICCNTLSNIYLKTKIKTSYKVKTILSYNLMHLQNKNILVTPSLKKTYAHDQRFISCRLAEYIEKMDIKKIIEEIKSIKSEKKLILGCTHYPLIKNLFKHYTDFPCVSYEEEMIAKLPIDKEMKFFSRSNEMNIIKKFFPSLCINEYTLT